MAVRQRSGPAASGSSAGATRRTSRRKLRSGHDGNGSQRDGLRASSASRGRVVRTGSGRGSPVSAGRVASLVSSAPAASTPVPPSRALSVANEVRTAAIAKAEADLARRGGVPDGASIVLVYCAAAGAAKHVAFSAGTTTARHLTTALRSWIDRKVPSNAWASPLQLFVETAPGRLTAIPETGILTDYGVEDGSLLVIVVEVAKKNKVDHTFGTVVVDAGAVERADVCARCTYITYDPKPFRALRSSRYYDRNLCPKCRYELDGST